MAKPKSKSKPKSKPQLPKLLPEKPIIILMIAGFVIGFVLYVALISPRTPPDISITHVEFYPGDGLVTLYVRSGEYLPARCDVIIDIDPEYGKSERIKEPLGTIEMNSVDSTASSEIVVHTTLPEGPFEYELALDCELFEYGWNLE